MQDVVEFNPENVYTLLHNGTDTYFKPRDYCRDRSETLSFLATCIDFAGTISTEGFAPNAYLDTQTKKHYDLDKRDYVDTNPPLAIKIIEGPITSGYNVYEKIAKGVAAILGAVIAGKNIFNIGGHSRGAVIAILVAWELERIKNDMLNTTAASTAEEIFNVICGNPNQAGISDTEKRCRQNLLSMLALIKDRLDILSIIREKFIYRAENHDIDTSEIWVNLFLIDPVPGNAVLRLNFLGWTDKRMFKYPAIVRNVEKICCKNEDTAFFDLLHTEKGPNTVIQEHIMPGHHGTPTGNPYGNNLEPLDSLGITDPNITCEHVQYMTMYLAIEFFRRNGSKFIVSIHDYPLSALYNRYISVQSHDGRKKIRLETYQHIHKNIAGYNALNRTVYISIAGRDFHEAFNDGPPELSKQTRPVIIDENNRKSNLGKILPFSSNFFVNQDHLKLYLDVSLGLNSTLTPHEQIRSLLNGEFTQENINVETEGIVAIIEDCIKTTVTSLAQQYLKNNMEAATKDAIIQTINQTLSIQIPDDEHHVVSKDQDNRVTEYTPLGKIKYNLIETLKNHLIEQINLQVQAYKGSVERMIVTLNSYPEDTENLNEIIYIDSLDKYKQLLNFAKHMQDLMDNITGHEDFKQQFSQAIKTVTTYASTLPLLISNILIDKKMEPITIPISDDSEENTIVTSFYEETKGFYELKTEKLENQIAEILSRKNSYTIKYCDMHILSGFVLTVGSLAVAAALVVLAIHAIGIGASLGMGFGGMLTISLGIFAAKNHAKQEAYSDALELLNLN